MIDCLRKIDLADFTTLRLGGKADYFCYVDNDQKFDKIITYCEKNDIPYIILGAGSNVLFSDKGFRGCVIKLSGSFRNISVQENIIKAGAGALISEVVGRAKEAGLKGLECMFGIPGTIGGAVFMNAGTKWGTVGERVRKVKTNGKNFFEVTKDMFGYRKGIEDLILGVEFILERSDEKDIENTISQIKKFRIDRFPRNSRTAGCIFKNPPNGPPAGKLIEQAGWKGKIIKNVLISDRHANYFIPLRNAKSCDFIESVAAIKEDVFKKYSFSLETEIKIFDENGKYKYV